MVKKFYILNTLFVLSIGKGHIRLRKVKKRIKHLRTSKDRP